MNPYTIYSNWYLLVISVKHYIVCTIRRQRPDRSLIEELTRRFDG